MISTEGYDLEEMSDRSYISFDEGDTHLFDNETEEALLLDGSEFVAFLNRERGAYNTKFDLLNVKHYSRGNAR